MLTKKINLEWELYDERPSILLLHPQFRLESSIWMQFPVCELSCPGSDFLEDLLRPDSTTDCCLTKSSAKCKGGQWLYEEDWLRNPVRLPKQISPLEHWLTWDRQEFLQAVEWKKTQVIHRESIQNKPFHSRNQ